MDRQLEAMSGQLAAARATHEAEQRLARIQALERAADALLNVARVAEEAAASATPAPLPAPLEIAYLLPATRAHLNVTVSAVLALGGRWLGSSHEVATSNKYTDLRALAGAAHGAMQEIDSALEDERRSRPSSDTG